MRTWLIASESQRTCTHCQQCSPASTGFENVWGGRDWWTCSESCYHHVARRYLRARVLRNWRFFFASYPTDEQWECYQGWWQAADWYRGEPFQRGTYVVQLQDHEAHIKIGWSDKLYLRSYSLMTQFGRLRSLLVLPCTQTGYTEGPLQHRFQRYLSPVYDQRRNASCWECFDCQSNTARKLVAELCRTYPDFIVHQATWAL